MRRRITTLTLGALLLASCGQDDWTPDELLTGQARTPQEEQLARGRESYNTYCVGCHGEQGDGEGPAAKFLSPKPRDLRKGKLKFAGVAANETPRDEDYVRVITRGLHGTSMPMWNLIPEQDVRDLVAFVRTYATDQKTPGAEVPIPADPWTKKPEKGIEEGEKLYHGLASCMNCHPAYVKHERIAEHMKAFDIPLSGFRTNLYQSETKESDWGAPIRPPDFWRDPMKAGATKQDLARVIATGIGGTAMPSWGATLTPKQLWGLAYYVESLTKQRGRAQSEREALLAQPAYVPPPPPPPPAPPPDAEGADAGAPDAATEAEPGAKAKDGKKDK